ncbi:SGNH/GDSL hydrolase family protein [Bacillaceae bacterium]
MPFFLRIFIGLAVLCFLLFGAGFLLALDHVLTPEGSALPPLDSPLDSPQEAGAEKKRPGTIRVVGLGDSLTRGVGDVEGLGYLGRLVRSLKAYGMAEVEVTNLAVSGAETADLLQQLEQRGVQNAIANADVLVLTIGGNDLFPGWDKLGDVDFSTYRGDLETFRKNAAKILTRLRTLNPSAPLFWLGLYQPFEGIEGFAPTTKTILAWNHAMELIALDYRDVYVVPVFDLFRGKTEKMLYNDHFHPNASGYSLIAQRLTTRVAHEFGLNP